MSEFKKDSYETFFKKIAAFKSLQNKQRQRGLNNYNLLTAVLSPSDEVRLHSRMIYSLLNPNGKHFQGALFLEKFLKVLNIKDFDLNLGSCSVYKEYENIDLYITDGTKHIIIENKIYAGDQEDQIKRYLEIIKKESVEASDILVVYLSLDRKVPSVLSLGGLKVEGDKLTNDGSEEALYKSITYKNHIMPWLEMCQHEVQNITNLNQAIVAYRDVVKMVNKEYKGAAMSLADYLKKNKEIYEMAEEVSRAVEEVRESVFDDRKKIAKPFFENVVSKLQAELKDSWVVEIKGDLSTKHSFPLRIYKKDWNKSLLIGLEFGVTGFHNCYLGVVRWNNSINIKGGIAKEYSADIKSLNRSLNIGTWWLDRQTFYKGDFIEYITTAENAEDNLVDEFKTLVQEFEGRSGLLSKINGSIQSRQDASE